MNKKIIGIFVCTLLITTALPVAVAMNVNQTNEETAITSSGGEDWPMFRHNPAHTGFSTSNTPDNKRVSWKFNIRASIAGVVAANNKVYVAVECDGTYGDEGLYCLDANHRSLWRWSHSFRHRCNPAIYGGRVYIVEYKTVYCLSADYGYDVWSYNYPCADSRYVGDPVVANGKIYFSFPTDDENKAFNVICLNAEDGAFIWKCDFETEESIGDSSVAVSNGKVYVTLEGECFYCLDAENGDTIWSYETSCISPSSAISNNRVYFGAVDSDKGKIYCLNAENGYFVWSYEFNKDPDLWNLISAGSPAVAYGKVYVGTYGEDGNQFHCFDAESGETIWSINKSIGDYPVIADGKVYTEVYDTVYCYDAETGKEKWSHTLQFKKDVRTGSPIIANGKVIVPFSYKKKILGPTNNYYNFGVLIAFGDRGRSRTRNIFDSGLLDSFPVLTKLLSCPIFKNLLNI